MKKIIILLLVISSIGINSQTDSIRINNLEKQIIALNDSINILKQDDASLYFLKRDIISTKENTFKLRKYFESEHDSLFSKFLTHWITWLSALLLGVISYVGYKNFLSNYVEKIEKEVDSTVAKEVAKKVKNSVDLINEQLQEINKHKSYKTESKIIVINKLGTEFPTHFIEVLKLFNTDIENSKNRVDLDNLGEFKNHLAKLKQADLVLIENMIPENVWDVKIYKDDYTALANSICDTTTMLYYGGGRLYTENIHVGKQHFVSFVTASSQLYGNMLNLLKYKFELNK